MDSWLKIEVGDTDNLSGLIIIQMPECIAWKHWSSIDADVHDLASYFGDMIKAYRRACQGVNVGATEFKLTIESEEYTILLSDLSPNYAGVYIFNQSARLGLCRFDVKRINDTVRKNLPSDTVIALTRGRRVMSFLHRYAPDAHTISRRISLRTGISVERIETPDKLNDHEVKTIESAAKKMLGLPSLGI